MAVLNCDRHHILGMLGFVQCRMRRQNAQQLRILTEWQPAAYLRGLNMPENSPAWQHIAKYRIAGLENETQITQQKETNNV